MPVNHEIVGRWYPPTTYEVTAEAIAAYADAVNDPNPAYRQGDDSIAPPLFGIVAGWGALASPIADAISADLLMLLVHLVQDMRFSRPVRVGDVLQCKAAMIGVEGGQRGTKATGHVIYTDASGAQIGEFFATIYLRGHGGEPSNGEAAPSTTVERSGDPIVVTTFSIDADQTTRYAQASGDHNLIHLDNDFATAVGLPGIINHGMNTLAQACWNAVENLLDGDSTRLTRFAGRFSKPVLPGQQLTNSIWASTSEGTWAFQTDGPDGAVIKDGLITAR